MAWGLVNNCNVDFISIEDINSKNIKTLKEKIMPKHFDILFTNPPYNRNLDLKMLKDLIDNNIANEIICVHPTTFLWKKDIVNDEMKKHLEKVDIFWGNALFKIQLFVPICVSIWNVNETFENIHVKDNGYANEEYDSNFEELNYHGKNNKIVNNFKKIIEKYMKDHNGSEFDHRINQKYENMTDFSVKFSAVRGNVEINKEGVTDNFWTTITTSGKENKVGKDFRYSNSISNTTYGKMMTLWSFNNTTEQDNFIIYNKTKVVRFLLTFTKFNGNLIASKPTRIIPWMDFSQTWTDEKLIKEFDISKELWNIIDKFIPDYYEDYKETARGNI